jgi:hypothetical protein
MAENEENPRKTPIVGRTFWDIAVGGTYIGGGLLTILILGIFIYFWLDEIPTWFFISIGSSLLFIPFLMDRAKEDADLFLVSHSPFNLTEYRVGRKYKLDIEGNGVLFVSDSGTYRTVLDYIDLDERIGRGSDFGGFTQIDMVRDANTLLSLTDLLQETLREQRENAQVVGVAVERQAKEIVDWALKVIQGALIPTEVEELFGITETEQTESEIIDDLDVEYHES